MRRAPQTNQDETNAIFWRACGILCATIKNRLSLLPGRDENQGTQE